jgi:cytidyltransferase-like protein
MVLDISINPTPIPSSSTQKFYDISGILHNALFNNTNILKKYKNSALAIGNFDGVHKGHQKVFKETKKIAKKEKIKFGVLTFTPLPIMFFNKKIKNYRLITEEQKFNSPTFLEKIVNLSLNQLSNPFINPPINIQV